MTKATTYNTLANLLLQDYAATAPLPVEPSLAGILSSVYGQGYSDPRLGLDSADSGTQNVLSLMNATQAAKAREPYEALARLFTTWMPPAAAAHRAVSNSNLPRAINYHNRLEQKAGNELVNGWTTPFLSPILAMMAPGMARAIRREGPSLADTVPSLIGRTLDKSDKATNLLSPHINDTAKILNHLDGMASRTPKYKAVY